MSLYTKALKYIDMSHVKELHQEEIKRKKNADEIGDQIREELRNLDSLEFYNWRYDFDVNIKESTKESTNTKRKSRKLKTLLGNRKKISESMTTGALMSTTLPADGDALTNDTINTGDLNSFDPELSYIKLNSADTPLSNAASSSVFPGAFGGDDVMYFNVPFASTDGNSASSPDFFMATTKPFKCESDTMTLKAIAGNSTGQGVGQGLGTNGGTQPWNSVDVWWFSYDDNGQLEDAGPLGEISNTLHTATNLEFAIPSELVGKNISINFYNNANNGGMTASSYLQGFSVPWHLRSLQKDSGSSDYSSQLAWTIINWNQLPSSNWYKQNVSSLQTMAFLLWSDMQGAYANDSQWWDQNTATTQGYPAPVSGSRYPPGTMSGETDVGMTDADLNYLVNWFQSNMSQYNGMTTTTYGIGDLKFKRKAPINVFVSLDTPEATAFIRTDPVMKGLSAEGRKKKLLDMLDAGDKYLLQQLGIIGSSARPSDPTMPPSWGDSAAQMAKAATNVAGGTALNPSLQAIGSQGRGLGGQIRLGQHGTGADAAARITAPVSDLKTQKKGIAGFKPGSRQNVYGTKSTFIDPSKSGAAADEFARAGAAAEAGGKGTAGRTAAQRAADLRAAGSAGKGTKIPVAYKPGTGPRMNIPGTKYAEVGLDATKATKGATLAQNAITKYPNSAKAAQLIKTGATTAKVGAAKTLARTLGKAVPFAGADISVADAANRFSKGDIAGGILSGLTAVPGPVGWTALAAQLATDATGVTGGAGKKSVTKEEKEHSNYQDYVNSAKQVLDKNNIKPDKDILDVLKRDLGLSDKLTDEEKEYLVDLFDNSKDVKPEEATAFMNKIIKKLGSKDTPSATKKQKTMVAHHEPKGETIMEKNKKSFKDLTKKIPGYYDGKPAPLGFPMQEPPEMIDGFHPDLVTPEGQKKQSNRYNGLDPQSAKAMPPTGNPHIDKKVRAAAKKPK